MQVSGFSIPFLWLALLLVCYVPYRRKLAALTQATDELSACLRRASEELCSCAIKPLLMHYDELQFVAPVGSAGLVNGFRLQVEVVRAQTRAIASVLQDGGRKWDVARRCTCSVT